MRCEKVDTSRVGAAVDPLKDHLRLVGKQSAVPGFLLVILDEETLKEHDVFSFDSFIFRLVSSERSDCKFSNRSFFVG